MEYVLLLITFFVYYLSLIFEFSWKISWFFLAITAIYIIVLYGVRALNNEIVYDKFLFMLGVFVFIIYEPFTIIFSDYGFPNINDLYITDDYTANMVGFITIVYILSFYLGHFLVFLTSQKKFIITNNESNFRNKDDHVKGWLIVVYFILAILPFFIFGSSNIIENFIFNLNARANGYVAFATGGLGSQNPIISLLAQSIPATIILLAIYMDRINIKKKFIVAIFMIFLLVLYISLGGRSGVVFVFMSIALFWYIRREDKTIPIIKIVLLISLTIGAITYQINTRDTGKINKIEKSGFTGFDLNREVTFIVQHYGLNENFLSANTTTKQIVLPLVETFYLFIVNPIPRLIWKNKPIDDSFGPYNKLRTGNTGFYHGSNITPTIEGRYYMKYGLIGVIEIGILIGILWTLANNMIKENIHQNKLKLIMPIAFVATLFSTTRDFAPGKFYPFLFIYLFYILNKTRIKDD